MLRRLIIMILEIKKDLESTHVGAYAAQSAYFIILSFLPLTIMLLSLVQFTGVGKADLYNLIQTVIPLWFRSWVIGMVDEMYSRTIDKISLSALVMVWSAGKSFMALNRGMNAICQVDRKPNYLMLRLRGAIFALIFVLLVSLSSAVVFVSLRHPDIATIHNIAIKMIPLDFIISRLSLSDYFVAIFFSHYVINL